MPSLVKEFGIGLTGNIATGKSTVANMIRTSGYTVIDADALAREVVAPGSAGLIEVVNTFGKDMLDSSGNLNREKLGGVIFANKALRDTLNQIMHPRIDAALMAELRRLGLEAKPRPWFYEASLIIERQRQSEFRAIWMTVCSERTQLQRLMQRSSLSETEALQRIRSQMPSAQKKTFADVVIDTDRPQSELQEMVHQLLKIHVPI